MSLRDFNEPSQPISSLHTEPAGNGAGLNSFHTIHPEERAPNNTPKIVGAVAVALMVGAAGIGLYAYSGPSSPKPVVADNNLPQPPAQAAAPVAPPPAPPAQQAADNSMPAPAPAASDNTPAPAPVKEASAKPIRHHKALSRDADTSTADNSANASSSQMASSAGQTRLNADSTGVTTQPQQQQAVTTPSATPLPAAPQPSPSDVASNNNQATQPVQSAAPAPETPTVQQPAQQQPAQQAPSPQQPEQAGAAPAPAQ